MNENLQKMFDDMQDDEALRAELQARYDIVEEADEADKPEAIREFLVFAQGKGYDLGVADGAELSDDELMAVVGGGNIFSDIWSGIKKGFDDLGDTLSKVGQDIYGGVKKLLKK